MIGNELTYKIIGCAMKVHNKMGPGFQEVIYQRCLAIELERAGLSFVREQEQTVYYDSIEVGTRREASRVGTTHIPFKETTDERDRPASANTNLPRKTNGDDDRWLLFQVRSPP